MYDGKEDGEAWRKKKKKKMLTSVEAEMTYNVHKYFYTKSEIEFFFPPSFLFFFNYLSIIIFDQTPFHPHRYPQHQPEYKGIGIRDPSTSLASRLHGYTWVPKICFRVATSSRERLHLAGSVRRRTFLNTPVPLDQYVNISPAMLLAMLIVWETEGHQHYASMSADQHIAYISDIGAQGLKPLFIAGCCVTTVFLDLSFASERWLRHTGRLAKNLGLAEKVLSALSSMSLPVSVIRSS